MSFVTFSDLGQLQMMRRDSAQLKSDLARLTSELSTGRTADLGAALGGDYSTLADLSRSLRLNATFRTSVTEAAIAAEGRQTGLERVAAELDGFAANLLSLSGQGNLVDLQLRLTNAPERFEHAVDALNTRLAGRSLFAADRPDQPALIDGSAIMDELRSLVTGAPDAATMIADVTAWFHDAGGGYETIAWMGGDGPPAPVLIGEGQSAETGVTALDSAVRETLTGLALAALASENIVPLSETEERALIQTAAETMQSAEASLITLRAGLGSEEARIEDARVSAEAARTSLETEYNRLVSADPYRTATDLEALSTQLETLYVLTSRLSGLSLTEYIR